MCPGLEGVLGRWRPPGLRNASDRSDQDAPRERQAGGEDEGKFGGGEQDGGTGREVQDQL